MRKIGATSQQFATWEKKLLDQFSGQKSSEDGKTFHSNRDEFIALPTVAYHR